MSNIFPPRVPNSHKGDYGRVLIIAGSPGMSGAGILAARGALRSGSGLVYLALPKLLLPQVDPVVPEVITLPHQDMIKIKADALAFGPGIGLGREAQQLLKIILADPRPKVIDADGLNLLAKNINLLKRNNGPLVLTPHPGEMARLTGLTIEQVQQERQKKAQELATSTGAFVVLKGDKTIVAAPGGMCYVNATGNPGMATAGSGDVLTGVIASLLARGVELFPALCAAVELHGLAGDLAAKDKGEWGVIASDIVENLPYAIRQLER